MDNEQVASLLLGLVAPNLVAVIVQPKWSDQLRVLVSLGVYMTVAAGVTWVNQGFDFSGASVWDDVSRNFGIVALAGFSSFKLYWQDSGITARIEDVTSREPVETVPDPDENAAESDEDAPEEPLPPRRL